MAPATIGYLSGCGFLPPASLVDMASAEVRPSISWRQQLMLSECYARPQSKLCHVGAKDRRALRLSDAAPKRAQLLCRSRRTRVARPRPVTSGRACPVISFPIVLTKPECGSFSISSPERLTSVDCRWRLALWPGRVSLSMRLTIETVQFTAMVADCRGDEERGALRPRCARRRPRQRGRRRGRRSRETTLRGGICGRVLRRTITEIVSSISPAGCLSPILVHN